MTRTNSQAAASPAFLHPYRLVVLGALALLVLLMSAVPAAQAQVLNDASGSNAPGVVRLIVKFAPGSSSQAQGAALSGAGASGTASIPQLRLQAITVPQAKAETVVAALKHNPNVVAVVDDLPRHVTGTPNDPSYGSQWSLPKIGWDQVFGATAIAGSATVAIVDTGIDGGHPDLQGNLAPGTSILDGSDGLNDGNGHGTAMAGIVAARTNNAQGVAGVGFAGVKAMPVNVLAADGTGWDSDIVAGVVYAADHGASVILLAFSNPGQSVALQDAIDYAWSHGAVVVAAAGNDGSSVPTYPAGDRGVVGVANTTEADTLNPSSNYGLAVFLAAPGTSILTTSPGGGYTSVTGTSASAAEVAGAAALLKAADGSLSNGTIIGRLARTADPAGTAGQTGNGRINLARAITDTSTDAIQPAGAPGGGPLVGPYVVAAFGPIKLDLTGVENYIYTVGDVITASSPVDSSGVKAYQFTVKNPGGAVVQQSACTVNGTTALTKTDTYTVQNADPVSTSSDWTYTLTQYTTNTCTVQDKTTSVAFDVAKGTVYANALLTTPQTTFGAATALSGTVAKTSGGANTTLTGTGTSFLGQLAVGDVIQVPHSGGADTRRVTAIASNTSLTVNLAWTANASGQTASRSVQAYVTVAGLEQSQTDYDVTWILPSTATACANTGGGDRPDTTAAGLMPDAAPAYLEYAPSDSVNNWNRDSNYETRPCPVFSTSNAGQWKLKLLRDSKHFVTLNVFSVDATAPSVTTNQAAGQADPTTAGPIHFTAVFSEAVTGFTGADVTITGTAGGTKTATVTEITPNDGTTYDVSVSGMTTAGTVIANIPAGGATDASGNGNTASTSSDNTVTYQPQVAPTFTFNLTSLPAKSYGDADFSVASYASSNSTGAISFALGSGSVGCTVTSVGLVSITSAATGANHCIIEASQAADANYFAAGPISQQFTIAQATSTTLVSCPLSVTYNGAAQTPCTVSVTGAGGLNLTPTAVYTDNLNAGTATASYTFAGDTNHSGSDDSESFTIAQAPVTATAGGGSTTYDAASHSPSACVVSGAYTGDLSCTNTPTSVGPDAGTTTITPVVSGTGLGNFLITPVNGSYTIGQATSTTAFGVAPTPTYPGGNFTVSASNNSGGAITYSYVSGPCAFVSGATFSSSGAGACVVRADSAATTNFLASSANQTVTISPANTAPTITNLTASPALIAKTGPSATSLVTATFTDPDTSDTHTCVFTWDGGSGTTPTVSESAGSGSCSSTATFTTTGVFTVTVTAADNHGGSANSATQATPITLFIVVYDPNAGFVTGGGWITSPVGACKLTTGCGLLTGKASFAFVSQYKKGANVPTGNTEFQFQAGNLNFKSTSYEWLVVAGARAQYKGVGTISGAGNYGFMLTAIDGEVNGGGGSDKFRIKIWDVASGNVVYDNQSGAADDATLTTILGGGSIVIHSK